MDEKGFRAFLKEGKRVPKGLKERVIRENMSIARRFEEYLARTSPPEPAEKASRHDVGRFIERALESEDRTVDRLLGLLRYARFVGNREIELELLVLLDGADVMAKLIAASEAHVGKGANDRIFAGFEPPPLGTPHKKMPRYTQDFMRRLKKGTDKETCKAILLTGVHAGPPEAYAEERRMLRESKDVDEYLARRRQRMIDLLAGHMKDGTLFYNQAIDQLSLDFVKGNPEVAGGVRKGGSIYHTRIPYMMKEYLREKDSTMRRYYYCHCPLARESILTGEKMDRDFCYCSAGYDKRPFDVAFGEPVKITILKSVLWGDDYCRSRMEIPEKYRTKRRGERRQSKTRARPRKK